MRRLIAPPFLRSSFNEAPARMRGKTWHKRHRGKMWLGFNEAPARMRGKTGRPLVGKPDNPELQ